MDEERTTKRGEGELESMLALSIAVLLFELETVYPECAAWRLMEEMKMRIFTTASGLTMAAVMLAASATARGQAAPATPCDAATKTDCKTPAPAPPKNATQQFPFPGEAPSAGERPPDWGPDAPADPPAPTPKKVPPAYPGDPDAPASKSTPPAYPGDPDAPAQTKTPRTAPPAYPGEPDAPAANAPGASKDSGSSSSSSSGDPAWNPDAPDDPGPLKDAGSSGDDTKVTTHRKKLPKVSPETPESRAAEDVSVAEFYQNAGNYAAAYLRAKDAVQYQPDDPYTHFTLAEAARKLGKTEEAKGEYAAVLKLDPIPKQLKATQKALAEMASAK
jgi:hypothetical protein